MAIKAAFKDKYTITARVIPRFPIAVVGVGGITIHKQNGIYTFALNPFYPLGDAPHDNKVYGRINGTWTVVVGEAPTDGEIYGRRGSDGTWQLVSAAGGGGGDWADITGKPSVFPPDIEMVDDRVAQLLQAGANVTIDYNDPSGAITISSTASGFPEAPGGGRVYARRGSDASWQTALPQMLPVADMPTAPGQITMEMTDDNVVTFRLCGSDGIVRSFEMPMAEPVVPGPAGPSLDLGDPNNAVLIAALEDPF